MVNFFIGIVLLQWVIKQAESTNAQTKSEADCILSEFKDS